MSYIPGLSRMLASPLLASVDTSSALKTVEMLDEYGLSRDDMLESLGEFSFSSGNSHPNPITRLTSAAKSALTRAYNSSVHHSQAIVSDVNVGKGAGKKGKSAVANADPAEFNGGDGDKDMAANDNGSDEDEEDNVESIAKAFVVQGKRGKTSMSSSSSNSKNRGKKIKKRKE